SQPSRQKLIRSEGETEGLVRSCKELWVNSVHVWRLRGFSPARVPAGLVRAPYRTGPTLLSPPQSGSTSAWTAGTISVVTVSTWRTILQAGAQQRYKLHVYCTCKPAYKCCTCLHAAYTATVKLITNTVCVNALLQRLCAEREGSLASAHSALEYHYLQRLAQKGGHTFAWLGGYHFLGEWRWEGGSPFDYVNTESDVSPSENQCLLINTEGNKGWSNHRCNNFFPYICEMRSSC
uniref:Ladderlectin-like n=1 Tax=Gadus morhua TaxID=8049 RepID=A0A8C5BK12_GADMO